MATYRLDERTHRHVGGGHDGQKTKMIERVFEACSDLPFVMIGDTGQRDLDIYSAIAEKHPKRVRAAVMHELTPGEQNAEAFVATNQLEAPDIPVNRTDDYNEAKNYLREQGII